MISKALHASKKVPSAFALTSMRADRPRRAQAALRDPLPRLPQGEKAFKTRVDLQGRALRLFGQWRRVSRSGIPSLNSCQCSYDVDLDTQDLDPLMLEYLSNKFPQSDDLQTLLRQYQSDGARFRSCVSWLLDDVVKSEVKIPDAELEQVLDALEISINSIEEMMA
jgi:hypothetical protein